MLWTGGGSPPPKNGRSNFNAEIFSPPYLFKGDRPGVDFAPTMAKLGDAITLGTPDAAAIRAVNLLRIGLVTHTFNMNGESTGCRSGDEQRGAGDAPIGSVALSGAP